MSKVKDLNPNHEVPSEAKAPEQPQQMPKIAISGNALNGFGNILQVILVGDDRLKPIMAHYQTMIQEALASNEKDKQQ